LLKGNATLAELDLNLFNKIGDAGAIGVCKALKFKGNATLTTLLLFFNQCRSAMREARWAQKGT
jgi:hypothetical protein